MTTKTPHEVRHLRVETTAGRLVIRYYSDRSIRVLTQVFQGESWITSGAIDLAEDAQLELAALLCGSVREVDMGAA